MLTPWTNASLMSKQPHSNLILRGLVLLLAFDAVFILCFWGAGEAAFARSFIFDQAFPFESRIPFLPVWVLIYNSLWILGTLVFLQRPSPSDLRPVLWTILFQIGIAVPIFVLFPTGQSFPRGELPTGWLGNFYRYTDLVNMQRNAFPSLHVTLALTFAAAATPKCRPLWIKATLWLWSIAICCSTVFIHEHHLADVAGGIALSWVGVYFIMRPLQRGRATLGLRHAADLRSLGMLWLFGMIAFLQWTGWLRSPWLFVLSLPLAFSACSIAHNHIHLPVFRSLRANTTFSCILGFFSGQPPCAIVAAHNIRHHGMLGTRADYVRPSVAPFRWNWLNVLAFPFAAMLGMYRDQILRRRPKISTPPIKGAILQRLIFYSGVAVLLIINPTATLAFLITPWIFGQLCIVGINLIQHQGCDPESHWNHSRNITGRPINWLLLNGGYHTAHHERPALHWSQLPKFHRQEVTPHIDPRLDFRSLSAAILTRMRTPAPTDSDTHTFPLR